MFVSTHVLGCLPPKAKFIEATSALHKKVDEARIAKNFEFLGANLYLLSKRYFSLATVYTGKDAPEREGYLNLAKEFLAEWFGLHNKRLKPDVSAFYDKKLLAISELMASSGTQGDSPPADKEQPKAIQSPPESLLEALALHQKQAAEKLDKAKKALRERADTQGVRSIFITKTKSAKELGFTYYQDFTTELNKILAEKGEVMVERKKGVRLAPEPIMEETRQFTRQQVQGFVSKFKAAAKAAEFATDDEKYLLDRIISFFDFSAQTDGQRQALLLIVQSHMGEYIGQNGEERLLRAFESYLQAV